MFIEGCRKAKRTEYQTSTVAAFSDLQWSVAYTLYSVHVQRARSEIGENAARNGVVSALLSFLS